MMTLYVLFEDLERRRYSLESPLIVSEYAAAQTPTKLGLQSGEIIRVDEAIRALVTHSANDAAVAIAENLEGTELAFAARMTRTAHGLGMTGTQFRNASGLPNPDQYSTARDMVLLGAALQTHFPRYFAYFKTGSFSFRGRRTEPQSPVGPGRGCRRHQDRLYPRIGLQHRHVRSSWRARVRCRRDGWATAAGRDQQMESLIGSYLPGAMVASTRSAELPRSRETQAGVSKRDANPSSRPKIRAASALSP